MRTIWILIANASEARLFKMDNKVKQLKLIKTFNHPESREKAQALVTDIPGRYRKSPSPKSMYEFTTHPKQVEAKRFAHELAGKLDQGRTRQSYHKLVIIAPAHFQGLLNKCCNPHVKNLVVKKLHKDYTKISEHKLTTCLNDSVALKKVA